MDICVFTITCDEITAAVLGAHKRGVRVRIITDNDQVSKNSFEGHLPAAATTNYSIALLLPDEEIEALQKGK